MVTANNSVALNWTLNFPSNLNVTGYKFLIRWESENREVCDDGHIKQNSVGKPVVCNMELEPWASFLIFQRGDAKNFRQVSSLISDVETK